MISETCSCGFSVTFAAAVMPAQTAEWVTQGKLTAAELAFENEKRLLRAWEWDHAEACPAMASHIARPARIEAEVRQEAEASRAKQRKYNADRKAAREAAKVIE